LVTARTTHEISPIGVVDADEQAEPPVRSEFDDVVGWRRVGPDHGEPGVPHRREVTFDALAVGEQSAVLSGSERPVGHPTEREPLVAESEELAIGDRKSTRLN